MVWEPGGATLPATRLGTSGFVFLDDERRPFAVREYHSGWWLHRWSDHIRGFITYRQVNPSEVELYHDPGARDAGEQVAAQVKAAVATQAHVGQDDVGPGLDR